MKIIMVLVVLAFCVASAFAADPVPVTMYKTEDGKLYQTIDEAKAAQVDNGFLTLWESYFVNETPFVKQMGPMVYGFLKANWDSVVALMAKRSAAIEK